MSRRQSHGRVTAESGQQPSDSRRSAPGVGSRRANTTVARRGERRTQTQLKSMSRGSSQATTAGSSGTSGPRRTPQRQVQRSLRGKLMLAMAGMTAGAMIVLGLVLSSTANAFLFGQVQHKGIELAKMAAQVGRAVVDRWSRSGYRNRDEMESHLHELLTNAVTWGDSEPREFSDIVGITFDRDPLSALGLGDQPDATVQATIQPGLTIPRLGWVPLPDDIQMASTTRPTGDAVIPVYRYKVRLNNRGGIGFEEGFHIWVDLAADKVHAVRNRLYIIVAIAVVLTMGIVLWLANVLAASITRPVMILMRDMEEVAQGNLEHQSKVRSNDEVGVLAQTFNQMTEDLAQAQEALVEQEKAAYELSIAQEVQQQLLPASAPQMAGYEPFSFYRGAKAVSGDYYDFIPLGQGHWGFIVADVSGKGIPGSMVMAVMRTIIRLTAPKHLNRAADTLKETNRLIAKQIKRGMFVTAFYAILDEASGALTYASAGHNPMVLYRAASRTYELAAPKGIAIGFNEGPLFDKNIQEFQTILHPGDQLVLYTDGFPEAMSEDNEEFGDERFYSTLAASGHLGAEGMTQHLLQALEQHRGRAAQSDDLTMIAVRRSPG